MSFLLSSTVKEGKSNSLFVKVQFMLFLPCINNFLFVLPLFGKVARVFMKYVGMEWGFYPMFSFIFRRAYLL